MAFRWILFLISTLKTQNFKMVKLFVNTKSKIPPRIRGARFNPPSGRHASISTKRGALHVASRCGAPPTREATLWLTLFQKAKSPSFAWAFILFGRGRIRTHGPIAGSPVFKTGAIGHSATLPHGKVELLYRIP
jgi:hypothetical protein